MREAGCDVGKLVQQNMRFGGAQLFVEDGSHAAELRFFSS